MFIVTPSGICAVWAFMEDSLYPSDFAVFNFEQLRELPGPINRYMIEESEGKCNSALAIHRHKTAIAYP